MNWLGGFVMRGRHEAILAATTLALLASVLPLFNILSSVVVGLVTLRHGARDGLLVGLISALVSGLAAEFLLGGSQWVVGLLLVLWAPVWLLSAVLHRTRSLSLTVQVGLALGALAVLLLHLGSGSPEDQWREVAQSMADTLVQAKVLEPARVADFVTQMAAWMTAMMAGALYFQVLLTLVLARAWQARLYNPGGFRREFLALGMFPPVGWLGVPLLGALLVWGIEAPALARDLGALWIPLGLLQGLAVAHALVARFELRQGWLAALYTLLLLAMPHAELVVAVVGLVDVFLDFRGRLGAGPKA